jgi:hypothetical protein
MRGTSASSSMERERNNGIGKQYRREEGKDYDMKRKKTG